MNTVDLRVPGDLQRQLLADLTQDGEWAGYLMCGLLRDRHREVLLGRSWHPVPAAMEIKGTSHGFSWRSDFDVLMLNIAQRENLSCVVLHYHGGDSPRLGHTSDRQTANSLMPFLSKEAPGRPHIFGVLGDHAASGVIFQDGAEEGALGSLRVSTTYLDEWSGSNSRHPGDRGVPERHDRLSRGFGPEAYRRLRDLTVGIVGCGGGGSHVIQQLAYLGIGNLILVDADVVEESNLNRLIGASGPKPSRTFWRRFWRRAKGDLGATKVSVMERMIREIDHSIDVVRLPTRFPDTETIEILRRSDVIVSCVDSLHARDDLQRLCKRYLIPMIDIGIEIAPVPGSPGSIQAIPGRVTKVLADGPCLRCQGIIDDGKLESERGGRPLGYANTARLPDPAVVTLNGVVASLAASDVLQLATGFAERESPNAGWLFDGLSGEVTRAAKNYDPTRMCESERGLGDP